ncbi:MAG TPA: sn-glycerol-3-phosphate ABC transporter ATP-binding protein UgpC [Rhodopila sp.]
MAGLTVRRVSKHFGSVEVLKDVSLDIENGAFTVLVGPSGCGKSTLLSIIAGLETASAGDIEIGGRSMNGVAAKDRNIAMVFQSYALYPAMTVRQNVTFGMECRGVPKARQKEAVERVARLLQIEALLDRRPAQLSGGQRQRVAMGRALVRDPALFLFDEPLSNLDAQLRVEMRAEIKQLHARIGTTCVYVTHDQVEAMTMATRIAVMDRGEVQQFADPDTIYNRPANLFVARFMGAPPMNTIPARLDGDGSSVMVGSGEESIRLKLHGASASRGSEIVLGIRPECIAEPQRRFGTDDAPPTMIDAVVEMTEPTGAETIVMLRLGGQRVIGRVAADMALPWGSKQRFSIDTRKLCLFDPASERLIA